MASKTTLSDYRFSIFINNDQAKRSLVEMEKVMQGYEAELSKLVREKKKDTDEYRNAKKAYDNHLEAMKKVRQEAGLQALSLKELKSLRAQLNNELARVVPGSENFKKIGVEIGEVNNRINQLQNGAKNTGLSFGKLADGFNRYFAIVGAGIAALSGFAFTIKEMITAQGELDDSLANIRKSTGMTAAEVQKLNSELGKINTRTSRQELREMAVVAGQIGVAKDDVFAFVESVDKLNVALGDEFTGGAEEVAKQMGMMRNVLTDMKTGNIADDMMRLGNAINTLGAAGFATGPVMADFASRIGGIGISLGLSSDEVLGLSATLQELNVNAERGGTAVVKILQKMTTNTDTFAKIAGVPLQEFTDLVNTDLYGAFMKVIEGSNKGGTSATALAGIIKELEISGVGASEIFAKLGNNTDMVAEKVGMAGKALQGTDSIMKEFDIKNATLGATMDKLRKDFYNLITLPGVTEFFKNQVYHVVQLVNWLKDLPLIIEKYKIALIAIAGATGVWIAASTRSMQIAVLNNLLLKEGIGLKIKQAIATLRAASAQEIFNKVLKANPLGIIITAITTLIGLIAAYDKYNSKALATERMKASATVLLANANNKLEQSYSQLQKQVSAMNTLSQQEKVNLQETLDLKIKNAEADLIAAKARRDAIGKQAGSTITTWQGIKAAFSAPGADENRKVTDYYKWENAKEATEPFNDGINQMQQSLEKLKAMKSEILSVVNAESAADKIVAKTQEALTEKLSKYQTALRNTTAGSEEYSRIQGKIKETNKELAKFNSDQSEPDKVKKLKTEYEKLGDAIKELTDQLQSEVSKNPEKAAAIAKEITSLQKQKKAIDDLVTSYLNLNNQEEIIVKQGFEAFSSNYDEIFKFRKEAGIVTANEIASYEIYKLKQTTAWALANEKDRAAAIKKIREDAGLTVLPDGESIEEWTPDNYAGNKKKEDEEQGEALGKAGGIGAKVGQWAEKAKKFINTYVNPVMDGIIQIDQLMSQKENQQLERDRFNNEEKKKNLKRQLDAKLISQKQYDAGVAKLDQEMEAKKRELQVKQAKRQKVISLTQAIINTALSVTSALSMQPFIVGLVMSVLAAALGAFQIATISNTSVPEAAKGRYNRFMKTRQAAMGRYDVLGEDDNKQYRGVPLVKNPESGVYDRPTLFAETGREIILNPKHTENLMRFRPDLVEAIMSVPQRYAGAYPAFSSSDRQQPSAMTIRFDQETLDEMRSFREQLKKPVRAGVLYDDLMESMDTVSMIEKSATR
jgi:TP901 family phage tail tape measure protein